MNHLRRQVAAALRPILRRRNMSLVQAWLLIRVGSCNAGITCAELIDESGKTRNAVYSSLKYLCLDGYLVRTPTGRVTGNLKPTGIYAITPLGESMLAHLTERRAAA